jgi:hypothetical protein
MLNKSFQTVLIKFEKIYLTLCIITLFDCCCEGLEVAVAYPEFHFGGGGIWVFDLVTSDMVWTSVSQPFSHGGPVKLWIILRRPVITYDYELCLFFYIFHMFYMFIYFSANR